MSLLRTIKALFTPVPRRKPVECFAAVRAGGAVLVDVREPSEWKSGVVAGAELLPLSDLMGSRKKWSAFIAEVGEREVLLYCKAGGRSAIAAKLLRRDGIKGVDAGALHQWRAAGWPVTPPPSADRKFTSEP